jgi:hypothetical protein
MRSMAGAPQSPEELGLGQPRIALVSEQPYQPRRRQPAAVLPEPSTAPPPTAALLPAAPLTDTTRRELQLAAAVGFLRAAAAILAVRWILLLTCCGAFVLAFIAKDWLGLGTFVAFCCLVIIPLIFLDYSTRRAKT